MRALLLLIFSFNLIAGEVTCENGTCDPNINSLELYSKEELNDSYISIKSPTEKISIKSGDKTSPRNLRIFIDENNGKDLDVDMTSTKIDNDAANTIVFSDYISNLNFKSNGKTGVDAKTASYKCAQKVLNGDLGEDVKQDFIDRRLANPSIPNDRCVADDLAIVKNNQYSCPEGFENNGSTNLKSTRWVKKRKCRGLSQRKMCVEKKVKISCKWLAANISGCNKTPPPNFGDVVWKYNSAFCSSTNSGFYADRPAVIKTETWLRNMRKTYSDKVICNLVTDRVGKLNQYYKSAYVSTITGAGYNRQETATYNTSTNKMYLNMYYGRWYGYRPNGGGTDPNPYIPSGHTLKRLIQYRGCNETGTKYGSHMKSLLDRGCGSSFTTRRGLRWQDMGTMLRYTTYYPSKYVTYHYYVEYCSNEDIDSGTCYSYEKRKITVTSSYPSPGYWETSKFALINQASAYHSEHYGAQNGSYEGLQGTDAVRCYKSGSSVVCRFLYNQSVSECGDWDCWTGTIRKENTTFLTEATSSWWQVQYEVMSPVGSLMIITQMMGVGNY